MHRVSVSPSTPNETTPAAPAALSCARPPMRTRLRARPRVAGGALCAAFRVEDRALGSGEGPAGGQGGRERKRSGAAATRVMGGPGGAGRGGRGC